MDKCQCGSGLDRRALHDGYGIFLCYVCDKCQDEKLRGYRRDIFTHYHAEEPIEPDE